MPDDLKAVIDKAIAAGYSDDDVRLVAKAFQAKNAAPKTTAAQDRGRSVIADMQADRDAKETSGVGRINQWIDAGPHAVKEGLRSMALGGVDVAARKPGGLGRVAGGVADVVTGAGITALPMIPALAPQVLRSMAAAPIATATRVGLGTVGAVGGSAAVREMGGGEGTQRLAGVVGGTVAGGPVATKAIDLTKRGTQAVSQKLYERIFPHSDAEVVAAERAAAGRQAGQAVAEPETLAQAMRERGVYGRPAEQGGQLRNRLDEVESVLQSEAAQVQIALPNRGSYLRALQQIATHYRGQDFAPEPAEAAALSRALVASRRVSGDTALRLRRFLDGQRRSFDAQKVVGPAQANLRGASDQLRGVLHQQPRLSPLIREEERLLQGLERTAYWGAKPAAPPTAGDVFALGTGSVPAVVASTGQHLVKAPTVTTTIAQGLHRLSGGGVAPAVPTLPARAAQMGAGGAGAAAGGGGPRGGPGPGGGPRVPPSRFLTGPRSGRALPPASGAAFVEGEVVPYEQRLLPAHQPAQLRAAPARVFSVDAAGRVSSDDAELQQVIQAELTARMQGRPVTDIKGLLPPAVRRVDAQGREVPVMLNPTDASRQAIRPAYEPTGEGGRVVPAAPIRYDIDPHVTATNGVRVAQYSGDADAAAAPFVTAENRPMLERMLSDLDELRPSRSGLVIDRLRGDSTYQYGHAGSPVADDVAVLSGARVSNRQIMGAIQDVLDGKPPTNKLHTAVLDAAQGYLEKRAGYRGPAMPEGMSSAYQPRTAAERAALEAHRAWSSASTNYRRALDKKIGGSAAGKELRIRMLRAEERYRALEAKIPKLPAEDDGFAAFSDAVDEIASLPE